MSIMFQGCQRTGGHRFAESCTDSSIASPAHCARRTQFFSRMVRNKNAGQPAQRRAAVCQFHAFP